MGFAERASPKAACGVSRRYMHVVGEPETEKPTGAAAALEVDAEDPEVGKFEAPEWVSW